MIEIIGTHDVDFTWIRPAVNDREPVSIVFTENRIKDFTVIVVFSELYARALFLPWFFKNL